MRKIQLLLLASLSASLGLAGCTSQPAKDSHLVDEESYKAEMIDRGFFIHQNVTYSGTASMGAVTLNLSAKIADNAIETYSGLTEGSSSYFRFDYSTLSDGMVYTQAYVVEPGGDYYDGNYMAGVFSLDEISTESTYILVVDFDKLSYDEETKTYNLIEPTTQGVGADEMLISELSYQFVNGKLDYYKVKFAPSDNPLMGMSAELRATDRGTTSVSFPLIKHVDSGVFSNWISKYTNFQFDSSVTLEIEANVCGEITRKVVKFDDTKIDELIYDKDGNQTDHTYYSFDEESYNEETGAIDYDVYMFSESSQAWYTMPSGGIYLNIVKFRAELVDFAFNKFNFNEEKGVYELKEKTSFEKISTTYVCEEYNVGFLYEELQSYSYVAYEDGFEDDDDHIYSVSVNVKDIDSTTVTLPTIA